MPIRFRRTFKLFPGVKVNLSRGGVSFTVGPRGARLNFSKRGVKQTVGIPGSGLSETSYIIKNEPESKKKKDDEKEEKSESADQEEAEIEHGCFPWGCLLFLMVFAIGGYLFAYANHLLPANFVSNIIQGIAEWIKNAGM
ncbi:MAG: DUF4236 domain-containing protein [Anaerolineales bacterium]